MIDKLYELNYEFDREFLLQEALYKGEWDNFVDPSNGYVFDEWFSKNVIDGYAKSISEEFSLLLNTSNKPKFLYQKAGYTIPFHKDRGTKCSINFILNETDDMISFRDSNIFYRTALLNTQEKHAVLNPKYDRIMLKLSIFDKTYHDVLDTVRKIM